MNPRRRRRRHSSSSSAAGIADAARGPIGESGIRVTRGENFAGGRRLVVGARGVVRIAALVAVVVAAVVAHFGKSGVGGEA